MAQHSKKTIEETYSKETYTTVRQEDDRGDV